jgi:hypothetical protein
MTIHIHYTAEEFDHLFLKKRDRVIRELATEAMKYKIPDSEGGWDIREDVANWLMDQLKDTQQQQEDPTARRSTPQEDNDA